MSFFSRLFYCCFPQNNDNLPPQTKNMKRILPDSSVILSVPKEQQNMLERATLRRDDLSHQTPESLIFCYGLLSSYLHLQRLPHSISKQYRVITQIIVGEAHCIMMLIDGSLVGIGSNEYGQLGFPTHSNHGTDDNEITEQSTVFVENITQLKIQGLNLNDRKSKDIIEQMTAGKNHNVLLVRNSATNQRKLISFGYENGIGIDGQTSTHIPVQINIPKLGKNCDYLSFIYTRHNTNIAVDKQNRLIIWGEDSNSLRLRKPKIFYQFNSKVKQVALGKRHGIVLTQELGIYGWGDGTYGELGIQENLPIESPISIPFFSNMQIDQIAAGARHTLALDSQGNIYAIGDNSEDQCAISGRRANQPEKILKDFKVNQIYAGDSHNVTVSHDKNLYSWGGSMINSSWGINSSSNESKLRLMEDLKRRNITLVDLSYSNTIIITEQSL